MCVQQLYTRVSNTNECWMLNEKQTTRKKKKRIIQFVNACVRTIHSFVTNDQQQQHIHSISLSYIKRNPAMGVEPLAKCVAHTQCCSKMLSITSPVFVFARVWRSPKYYFGAQFRFDLCIHLMVCSMFLTINMCTCYAFSFWTRKKLREMNTD